MSKTAILTGAGGGIGRSIAKALASSGYFVVCTDIDPTLGTAAARLAGNAVFRELDVTDGDAIDRIVGETAGASGLDLLVNNAGAIHFGRLTETSDAAWRTVFETNLTGPFRLCRAAIPHLVRSRGKIINIASWTGKIGRPSLAAYSASKFGLIGLTQSLAAELAEDGVVVNAVCPGTISHTHMGARSDELARSQGRPAAAERVRDIPLGRLGTPDDIAQTVAFLASPAADYITGQAISVSGGMVMG